MIVCAIDDLIFSIKIKTAAKQLGVDIHFERARENVLPAGAREAAVAGHLRPEQLTPGADGGHRGDESRPGAEAM